MTDEKKEFTLKNKEIPADVMKKLTENRKNIVNHTYQQEKRKLRNNPKMYILVAVAIFLFLPMGLNPKVHLAIKEFLGISQDTGVSMIETQGIQTELDLVSVQNDREIKLTKFISTKSKFAFDYQFEIDDEKLKTILAKEEAANSNYQMIDFGLFDEGKNEDLVGGVMTSSTFRIEGNTFLGSVLVSYSRDRIPADAKLNLHIYRLAWEDRNVYEAQVKKNSNGFSVPMALEYTGDWTFKIVHKPLTQTSIPTVSNVKNIENIKAKSDPLQTTVRFTAPIETIEEGQEISKFYASTLYQNGMKINDQMSTETWDTINGDFELSFNLSSLDHTSIYQIQINEIDSLGNPIKEIGSFDIQNK